MTQLPYINLTRHAVTDLARRYALTLVGAAAEGNVLDSVADDMVGMRTLWNESPLFRRFAGYPEIVRSRAAGIVDVLSSHMGWQALTCRFFVLLAQHKRLTLIPSVVDAFVEARHAHRGERVADVITATPLSESQHTRLVDSLQPLGNGQTVVVTVRENPHLLGGLVVVYGSTLVDASLTGRLRRAAHALAHQGTTIKPARVTTDASLPSSSTETVV